MSPVLLTFTLLDSDGRAVIPAGVASDLTLTLQNDKPAAVTFVKGSLVPEGAARDGSIFYLHFADLVDQADVSKIGLSAPGWQFQMFSDATYGLYWAAAPAAAVTLPSGATLSFSVANVLAAKASAQAQVYFDYYGVEGVGDGLYEELIAIEQPAPRT